MMTPEKKILIALGCIVLYIVLDILTNGASRVVILLGGIGYAMYRYG